MKEININDIEGIKIGHAHNKEALTGCSVMIFENGATAGVDIRGGAPGSRETALLKADKMVEKIHAIMLSGGSAYGLDAASGVMKYLEENDIGFDVGVAKVPIVSSAILFDLDIGSSKIRPNLNMGYEACVNASNKEFANGNIGAGMGATVGKLAGSTYKMKGGLGSAAYKVGELKLGAMVAVNCLGDVIDPKSQKIIAGAFDYNSNSFLNSENIMLSFDEDKNLFPSNTSLAIVVTNGKMIKVDANKIATKAHNAYAQTMSPAHTEYDGDTIFAVSTDEVEVDIDILNVLAVKALKEAVINAIKYAGSVNGVLSYKELKEKLKEK